MINDPEFPTELYDLFFRQQYSFIQTTKKSIFNLTNLLTINNNNKNNNKINLFKWKQYFGQQTNS